MISTRGAAFVQFFGKMPVTFIGKGNAGQEHAVEKLERRGQRIVGAAFEPQRARASCVE